MMKWWWQRRTDDRILKNLFDQFSMQIDKVLNHVLKCVFVVLSPAYYHLMQVLGYNWPAMAWSVAAGSLSSTCFSLSLAPGSPWVDRFRLLGGQAPVLAGGWSSGGASQGWLSNWSVKNRFPVEERLSAETITKNYFPFLTISTFYAVVFFLKQHKYCSWYLRCNISTFITSFSWDPVYNNVTWFPFSFHSAVCRLWS